MAVEEPAGPRALGLEELYERYGPALLRICQRRLGDTTRAEDACQETLLKAHRSIDSVRAGAPLGPWLATIARNVCRDMQRRERRIALVAEPSVRAVASEPAVEVDGRTRRRLVHDALRVLPLAYRRSVFLHHFAGLTYDEIAAHEGTSTAAVRSRLSRARRMLRTRIEELAESRGEWPLSAAAPLAWLRTRLARARVAVAQVEGTLGPGVTNVAPFAAALFVVAGLSGSAAPSVEVGPFADAAGSPRATAPSPMAAIAAAGAPTAPPRPPTRTATVPTAAAAPPPPPRSRVPTMTPPVGANGTLPDGTPWYVYFGGGGLSCHGTREGGPVTKLLCSTLES
jgi:RNA polymerase sigma-70 factor (ECF subfamily)